MTPPTLPLKLALTFLTAATCLLSSCSYTDPEFASSAASATKTSGANDIVGKWFAYTENKGVVTGKSSSVLTLNSNGTGSLVRAGDGSALMHGKLQYDKKPLSVTWKYKGGGVWSFTQESPAGSMGTAISGTFRLANGRLLRSTKVIVPTAPIIGWGLMQNKEIFVRAGDSGAVKDELLRDNRSR